MKRIALTDGSGRWFDREKSIHFDEDTYWNGHNHISKATGSQWEHQRLYRTAGGRWILASWSAYQEVRDSYEEINDAAATVWLVLNGHDAHPSVSEQYSALEIG